MATFKQHAWASWIALVNKAQVLEQRPEEKVVGDGWGKLLDWRVMPTSHQHLTVIVCVWS